MIISHSVVATVEGAVIIDEVEYSKLSSELFIFFVHIIVTSYGYREPKANNERSQQICY